MVRGVECRSRTGIGDGDGTMCVVMDVMIRGMMIRGMRMGMRVGKDGVGGMVRMRMISIISG